MAEDKTPEQNEEPGTDAPEASTKEPRLAVQPEFWDTVLDALPPWMDEIVGIVLLVFGVISFSALVGLSTDATLAIAWSDALTSLFGYGSLLISAGIFILGVLIWLPKLGVTISFSTGRILALQVAFVSILAILHLVSGDGELRALARAGEGGGAIGWGVAMPLYWAFGRIITLITFGVILVVSLSVVVGVRRKQFFGWLQWIGERLVKYGTRTLEMNKPAEKPKPQPEPPPPLDPAKRRQNIVRIRPNLSNLPPSQRLQEIPISKQIEQAPTHLREPESLPDDVAERLNRALDHSSDMPLTFDPDTEFSIIGKLLDRKRKSDPQMVERPDGRIKQYFTVDEMKEDKKIGRRLKDLPNLDLLQDVEINPPSDLEINHNVVLIENTLLEFDINIDVVEVKVGPTVTQYAVKPFREKQGDNGEIIKERTRLSKIAALANDLALSLSTKSLRLETPVPGQSYMGIEVPNKTPSTVALRSVYESRVFYDKMQKAASPLVVPLGRDVAGDPVVVDLATMPHVLIAGTTGSGKSVCIAAIASALLLANRPDQVKVVMLDPKMVELTRFNGLPHLLGPVETDIERIVGVLRWCTREMDRRYKLLEENAARNIDTYNSRLGQRRKGEHLPHMVVFVDEIGDLMMSKPEETEQAITRLAQMARAVGMHLIVATQRPSVDVITGLIKANFPARIAFSVASGTDSRVILDSIGAETLLGKGDMLYHAPDAGAPKRLQGCFVTDDEVRDLVQYWRDWSVENLSEDERRISAPWERGLTRREFLAETDPMLEDAIELVVREQEASASMIQRKLGLGYPRAARLVDLMEELGIVGESVDGGRSRSVLMEKGKDPFKEILERRAKQK